MVHIQKSGDEFPLKRNFADAVLMWGRELSARGLASPKHGSLSYRYGLGFVITPGNYDPGRLDETPMVYVEQWDFSKAVLTVRGREEPPPESFWHAMIYQNRSAAIFSFFASSPLLMKSAEKHGIPSISLSRDWAWFAKEMEADLGKGNILFIRRQGILSFGCTADDAGQALLSMAGM